MRERILNGWTITRALYVVMGIWVIIQSVMQSQWFGVLIGGYFASMGVFAFGCAAGNCSGNSCTIEAKQKRTKETQDISLDEVKAK